MKEMPLNHLAIAWQTSGGNPEVRAGIEAELQNRINNNRLYSREWLLHCNKTLNKVLSVHFIPTSEGFKNHGEYVTVLELTPKAEELAELLMNTVATPPVDTYGVIVCKVLNGDDADKVIAFDTKDILQVNI